MCIYILSFFKLYLYNYIEYVITSRFWTFFPIPLYIKIIAPHHALLWADNQFDIIPQ